MLGDFFWAQLCKMPASWQEGHKQKPTSVQPSEVLDVESPVTQHKSPEARGPAD